MIAAPIHISTFINDELNARSWDREMLTFAMLPEEKRNDQSTFEANYGVERLALDLLMEVHDAGCILGEQAHGLARAFGTSPEFWQSIHTQWREHPSIAADRERARSEPRHVEDARNE